MAPPKSVVDKFTNAFYREDLQNRLTWLGRKVVKNPADVLVAQEIIWETKPEVIVELGIFHGGATRFYAHLLDLMHTETGHDGNVVGVDLFYDPEFEYPEHPRIEFLLGKSSIDPGVVKAVTERTRGKRTMVILDSDHSCDHVLQELRRYAQLVSTGCYLIVEDTNPAGILIMGMRAPGPDDAIKAWQPSNHGFETDRSREKFLLTFHPNGFLKRVR